MPLLLKNKKKCIALQAQKPFQKKTKKIRAFLYTSHKGSLTIEAAMVLPLFMLAVIAVMYFLVIFQLQINIQTKLEDIARSIGKNAYITEDLNVFNYAYTKGCFLDEEFCDYLNRSYIVGGSSGISLIESTFFDREGVVDLVASYKVKIPFLSENTFMIACVQWTRFHTWIGKNIDAEEQTGQTVYITETGTVYHTNRDCSHLRLSIKETTYKEVKNLRNFNGGKYTKCSHCEGSNLSDETIIYITEDGDKWHTSLNCSGLKRNVTAIDISEVGERDLCSRCEVNNHRVFC